MRKRLATDLQKEDIRYIDATDALKKSDKLTYYIYDEHTNVLGHKILSDELYEKIKSLNK